MIEEIKSEEELKKENELITLNQKIIPTESENQNQNQNELTKTQQTKKEENKKKQQQQQQSHDKTFLDEEGNLLDPNDLSYNSEEETNSVIIFDMELNFVQKISQVDIVFLIDTTKSIKPYLKGIKRYIRKLSFDAKKSISHYLNDDYDVLKFGLVCYRDHDQEGIDNSYVSKILCDLNEDYNIFRQALYGISCKGGDDTCEAVADGLHEAVNLISWREESIKMIYHICGGPCHGSEFNGVNSGDKKFDNYQDGCPCGNQIKNILKSLRGKYIEYNLIALDDSLNNMADKFSKYIKVEFMEIAIEPQEGISGDQSQNDNDDN